MSYDEAAKHIGIPVSTLRSMVCRKQIPHLRLSARIVVFDLEDLDKWLGERRVSVGGGP